MNSYNFLFSFFVSILSKDNEKEYLGKESSSLYLNSFIPNGHLNEGVVILMIFSLYFILTKSLSGRTSNLRSSYLIYIVIHFINIIFQLL